MRRTTTVLLAASVSAALALGLAGCSGGDGGTKAEPDAPVTAATGEHIKTPGTDAGNEDVEAGGDGGGAGAECLVGTWVVDRQSVIDAAVASLALGAGEELTPEVTVTGDAYLSFAADGSMRTEYQQQKAELVVPVGGQEVRSVGTMNGALVGRYTVAGSDVTTSDLDASAVTYDLTGTIDGTPYDVGATATMTVDALEVGATSTFECTGDVLRITPQAPGLEPGTFISVYHRA